jgi:hypothetical protein
MPMQEIYLEQEFDSSLFQVLKSYDTAFAKEVFEGVGEDALKHLSKALSIDELYDSEDIPAAPEEFADFIWEELQDAAIEDGNTRSFFIVKRSSTSGNEFLYVSGDWPSAEAFVKDRLAH